MIISASRRTDIPALYSLWLLNRLRAGRVLVRNPFNRRQVSDIRLDPTVVDCLVLWTKNPAPLLPHVQEIETLGYPLVVHYTITACEQPLEYGLPSLTKRIAAFRKLAQLLGPERVLWRFDPILLTKPRGVQYCLDQFALLCQALQGLTHQCATSFVSLYAKCRRNLAGVDILSLDDLAKKELVLQLSAVAIDYGIRLKACCDSFLIKECSIEQAHCIDAVQLGRILGEELEGKKDSGQRPECGCTTSIDIGAYDSCTHGCRYCYANTNHQVAVRNYAAHDPDSPLLIGHLQGDETIRKRDMVSLRRQQPSLFSPCGMKKNSALLKR
ncbi:MAG: DUF1848 domain-containing protein [Desulfobulbus sp.]|nr:DUF1848 domain-containing protein [Desulfobulbus sp.]